VNRVDLDNSGLAELPPEIGERAGVQALSAWRNHLTSLPDWLWQLTELRFLNLGEKQLHEISGDIARLVNLHTLDLAHNALTSLPESMGDLPNLTRYLYLSNNRLSAVPASLGRLSRLGYLNISHNRITSVPDSFGNLDGLRESICAGTISKARPHGLTISKSAVAWCCYESDSSGGKLRRVRESPS